MYSARAFAAACALAATVLGACTTDPVASCESACEHQRSRMCNGFVGDENCVALCATAATEHDASATDAGRVGCGAQYDALYGCGAGGDFCDGARCAAEVDALMACAVPYCTANPSDPACATLVDDTYASCVDIADCDDIDDRCWSIDIPAAATSGNFCSRECASDAACESNFGFPGACYGLGGSAPLCFQTCDFDSDCYSSSVCIEVLTDTGSLDYICVPDN